MNKNLMPEVAELLGVELEEIFAIKTEKSIFRARITTSGLRIDYDSIIQPDRNNLLCGLLQGLYTIQRPSVDAVKHGHWIHVDELHSGDYFKCSECNSQLFLGFGWEASFESPADKFRYCPNCGAKMDNKEDENHDD